METNDKIKSIKKMVTEITHPNEVLFWTGDGESYYAEWNSVRKGYPSGCVDIKVRGGTNTYLFYVTADKITPAFNWKDGTPNLEVVEAYLENSSIYETVKYLKEMFNLSQKIMRL